MPVVVFVCKRADIELDLHVWFNIQPGRGGPNGLADRCVETHTGPLKSAVKRIAPQQLETHELIFNRHCCNLTLIKAAPDAKLLRGFYFVFLTYIAEYLRSKRNILNLKINDMTDYKGINTFDELIEREHGKIGTDSRNTYEERSQMFIVSEMLKEARKESKLTQE